MFPTHQLTVVDSRLIRDDLAMTAYRLPEIMDTTWFQQQLELLLMINIMHMYVLNNPLPDSAKNFRQPHWLMALMITRMFKTNAYTPAGVSMVCSAECVDFSTVDMILKMFSDTEYRYFTEAALAETIQDLGYQPKKETRYLMTLHPPGHPEHVYMIMRAKLNYLGKPDTVEHRHIAASLFSQIAPFVDSKYPKYPGGLSLIMHKETAKTIIKLHPQVRRVTAPPLKIMAKVLHNAGFADFDFSDPDQLEWRWNYDYYALANGITLREMTNYFNKLLQSYKTGLIASDFQGSTVQEALDTTQGLPVSPELFLAIGLSEK